jgi:hypothetical protein
MQLILPGWILRHLVEHVAKRITGRVGTSEDEIGHLIDDLVILEGTVIFISGDEFGEKISSITGAPVEGDVILEGIRTVLSENFMSYTFLYIRGLDRRYLVKLWSCHKKVPQWFIRDRE